MTVTESAFLAAIDERLTPALDAVRRAEAAVTRAKWRSLAAVLLALLALGATAQGEVLRRRQVADRAASRRSVCQTLNENIERARLQTEALVVVSNASPRPGETAAAKEQRSAAIRRYVELQHFHYQGGKVVAATIDCAAFVRNPATARPHFPKG